MSGCHRQEQASAAATFLVTSKPKVPKREVLTVRLWEPFYPFQELRFVNSYSHLSHSLIHTYGSTYGTVEKAMLCTQHYTSSGSSGKPEFI